MLLKVLHSYLLYMLLHRVSTSSFSKSMECLHAKRFHKNWLHCFSFLIFWLKEVCLYDLGEGTYEKWASFVSLGRGRNYEKEYLQKSAKIYDDFVVVVVVVVVASSV